MYGNYCNFLATNAGVSRSLVCHNPRPNQIVGGPFHAAVIVDVAEEQVAAFVPPHGPFRRPVGATVTTAKLGNGRIGRNNTLQVRCYYFYRHNFSPQIRMSIYETTPGRCRLGFRKTSCPDLSF